MTFPDIIIRWTDEATETTGLLFKVRENAYPRFTGGNKWGAMRFYTLAEAEAALDVWAEGMDIHDLAELRERGRITLDTLGGKYDTREEAEALLEAFPGRIVADAGPHCWPLFSIVTPPAVGDKVSYAFNGDCTPDGEVVKVSKSLKVVTTSTVAKFYRRRESGAWIKDGTWSLVPGHVSKRNPHF